MVVCFYLKHNISFWNLCSQLSCNVERVWGYISGEKPDRAAVQKKWRRQKSLPFGEGKHHRRHSACRRKGCPRAPFQFADRLSNVKGKTKNFCIKKCLLTLTLQNARPAIIDLRELSCHRYVLSVISSLHAFDSLDKVCHQMEDAALTAAMNEKGCSLILQESCPLPDGKVLMRLDFNKEG